MPQKNTSVSLGPHFEQFIDQQIHDGRYGSASETVRAGLQMALIEGEESGKADYSLKDLLAELDQERVN